MSSLFSRVSSARLHARVSLAATPRGGHASCFAERLLALNARCRTATLSTFAQTRCAQLTPSNVPSTASIKAS